MVVVVVVVVVSAAVVVVRVPNLLLPLVVADVAAGQVHVRGLVVVVVVV